MAAYISAKFEKDDIPNLEKIRVIVRNVDQGSVPPAPSASYAPTYPDEFQTFIVGEYVDDTQGERFDKVANLSELSSLTYSRLRIFEDPGGTLGAVNTGDILEVFIAETTEWTSDEYPGSNFYFSVSNPIDANTVELATDFPSFKTALSWTITRGVVTIASGSTGITRRENLAYPGPVQQFLEKRFNALFSSSVAAENFTEATKAEMTALANEQQNTTVVDETFTAEPTV